MLTAKNRVEGVNDVSPNTMTLHVGQTCDMPTTNRPMTGSSGITNCDQFTDGSSGCSVYAPTTNSYGPAFNANGGGWYAMERTDDFIKVWFWPRGGSGIPSDMESAAESINTSAWVRNFISGEEGDV